MLVSPSTAVTNTALHAVEAGLIAPPLEEAPPLMREAKTILQSESGGAPSKSPIKATQFSSNRNSAHNNDDYTNGITAFDKSDSGRGGNNLQQPQALQQLPSASVARPDFLASNLPNGSELSASSSPSKTTATSASVACEKVTNTSLRPSATTIASADDLNSYSDGDETPSDLLAEALAVADQVANTKV